MTHTTPTPRWMTLTLRFAAVYNLAWGVMAFTFPTQLFVWNGLPPPNYPSMIQCAGVVIGAFGIGYWIAAGDPVAHWPVVLIGLLSKLLAPVAFGWAIVRGELPSSVLASILLNDVAWWWPFTAILLHAAHVHSNRATDGTAGTLKEELQRSRTATGKSLWDLSFEHPLLIVFIRHLGCTFCREALADLHQQSERIASSGVTPIVVHMAQGENVQPLLKRYGLQDVASISDPDRRLFRAFELPLGKWRQLFGLRVLWRALAGGVVFRYGFGKVVGNPLQLTGAFLVHRGQIVRSFRHKTTADRPDYAELACGVLSPLPHSDGGEG